MPNAIEKYPVPLIFKKILKDKMSGKLIVTHPNFTKELFFQNGRLSFANTTLEHERIGEILMSQGKIDLSQLRMALGIRQNVPTKIGEILSQLADLGRKDIYDALLTQTRNIAVSTFPLKKGEWRFIVKPQELKKLQNLNIKTYEIIHAGCQLLDDFSYLKRRFLFRSPVTTELPGYAIKYLLPEEVHFHQELAQHFNVSVKQIIEDLQVPESTFWGNITLLYYLNVVDFVEYTVDNEEQNRKLEEISELHQQINTGQADYLKILGTEKIENPEQLDKIFADSADRYNPSKLDVAPDSTAMRRAKDVHEEIKKAYRQAKNEISKKPQFQPSPVPPAQPQTEPITQKPAQHQPEPINQTEPQKETPPINEEKPGLPKEEKHKQEEPKKNHRELYTKANQLYNLKKYFEASSLLMQAISIDDTRANYYYLLGLCQSRMPATKRAAEKNLKKAAQMESWNADPLFALGQLYRSEKLMRKAKECYEKALQLNMEHTLAGKAMDDLGFVGNRGKKASFSLFGKKK